MTTVAGFINGALQSEGEPDFTLGTNAAQFTRTSSGEFFNLDDGTDVFGIYNVAGTPEGSVAANIGSLALNTSAGEVFIKKTDTVNTGWVKLDAPGSADTATTADATPTTIRTISTANDTATTYKGTFSYRQTTDSSEAGGGEILVVGKNDGGTLSIVNSVFLFNSEDFSGDPTVQAVVSGTDLLIQVVGVAATNISWSLQTTSTNVV